MIDRLYAFLMLFRVIIDAKNIAKLRFALAQVEILKKRLGVKYVIPSPEERAWLMDIGSTIDHDVKDAVGIVTWGSYKRWLREKKNGKTPRQVSRKRTITEAMRNLFTRFAKENRNWGAKRIVGELKKLAVLMGASTIRRILAEEGMAPTPEKNRVPCVPTQYTIFVRSHINCIVATDFFIKNIYTLRGKFHAYCLVFIHLGKRRVFCSPPTLHPHEMWMMQQARNAAMWMEDEGIEARYLIHDGDKIFTAQFDNFFNRIFKKRNGKVRKTSPHSPDMNEYVSYCTSLAV